MKNILIPQTLAELLIQRKDIKDKGVTFVVAGNKENFLSYHALHTTALGWLGYLQKKGLKPGDELVFQVEDNQTFLQFFWACILGGIIPVPVAVIFLGENAQKLFRIGQSLNHPSLLTSRASYKKLFGDDATQDDSNQAVFQQVIFTDDEKEEELAGQLFSSTSDTIAFLQFSSGSTGTPKGVVLKNSNLIANIFSSISSHELYETDSHLSWMPLTHDMGLIGFHFYPMAAGVSHFLLPTDLFIRHPLLWLQKVSEHRVTVSCSPNFGYKYYLDRFTSEKGQGLDLSCLRIIFNGAEPISADLCRRFMATLAPFQLASGAMRPVYGLAEATLEVTFPRTPAVFQTLFVDRDALTIGQSVLKGSTPTAEAGQERLEVVNVGTLIDDIRVKISNEKGAALSDGHTGIIWIKGESVTQQYYNNEAATKAVIAPDGWLNTGDTGFMLNDCLYVVGRVKDIIFVKGLNVYPHDIEQTIEEMEGMETGKVVVCGIPDEEMASEAIGVFVIHKTSVEKFLPLATQIKRFVAARLGLEVKHVIPVRKIHKTTSGKVKRHFFVEEFRSGAYATIIQEIKQLLGGASDMAAVATPVDAALPIAISSETDSTLAIRSASIRQWIGNWLKGRFNLSAEDLSTERNFAGYGMTSFQAVALATDLESFLQTPIDTTVVFNYPTVQTLANHLATSIKEIPTAKDNLSTQPATTRLTDNRIAVIGMSCRLPGNVNSPEAFWALLKEQRNAITEVPTNRWDVDGYFDTDVDASGKMYTKQGGFVEQIDGFDPLFFDVSPREAAGMDPQQRLLLEVCWEALERAGLAPAGLRGSDCGVFIGMGTDDYQHIIHDRLSPTYFEDAFTSLGVERSIAAGRIAYLFDFHGPVLQLDTACSSSLLSVHQACQSLLQEECSMALAGGVNLMLSPDTTVKLCRMKALSPTGSCKTFDNEADGYVRGEGCGIVVLKRLSDAVANGDNILAVISGSAVNHDGLSNGLTAPNGVAQQQLIEKALRNAKLNANEIQYVEAHGTGTRLGDPVEVQALNAVYGQSRPANDPLIVGAVKTNIGHLEAAAGIAGFIKTVLCLQHQQIPGNLHLQQPNRFIPWKNLALKVADRLTPWLPLAGKRRAAISAFGLSGTNVHIIVEEARLEASLEAKLVAAATPKQPTQPAPNWPAYPVLLSAKKPEALQALAKQYLTLLDTPSVSLADISYSTAFTRNAFSHRLAFGASSLQHAQEYLRAYLDQTEIDGLLMGNAQAQKGKLVWLFTGGGSQYWSMGKSLYENNAVFKQVINHCDAFLKTKWNTDFSMTSLLYQMDANEANEVLQQMTYFQPALFALECALAEVWKSWGIFPSIVAGHSVGEYAAAYVAGVFSLDDGLTLVTERSRLMQSIKEPGAMATVFAAEDLVAEVIRPYGKDLSIAAINGPELTVMSGKKAAVGEALHILNQRGVNGRELLISQASHSPLMEPMLAEFLETAHRIQYRTPVLPLVSNVTGEVISHEIAQADYWTKHIVATVRFSKSIQTIKDLGGEVFMELGPQPNLLSMVQLTAAYESDCLLPSLQRSHSAWNRMVQSLVALHVKGMPVNWKQFYASHHFRQVLLPTYPFQRQRYWIDVEESKPAPVALHTPKSFPMTNHTTSSQPITAAVIPATNHRATILAALVALFANLLKMAPADINVYTRFLELGADSLVLAGVIRKIEKKYGLSFTMKQMFGEVNTLDLMASYIAQHSPAVEPAPAAVLPTEGMTPALPTPTQEPTVPVATPASPAFAPMALAPANADHYSLMQRQLDIMALQLQTLANQPLAAPASPGGGAAIPASLTPSAVPAVAAQPTPVLPTNGQAPKKHASIFPKMETKPGQTTYSPEQQAYLDNFIGCYTNKTPTSKSLTQQYRPTLADNRASAGFRFSTKEILYPILAASSEGSKIFDVDGNEYIDLAMGFGVNLLGHRPEAVTNALQQQLQQGYPLGPQSPLSGEVATLIAALTGMERVSFHNSGTEAVMTAARLARTVTGKRKIAIFSGSYHGHFDGTLAVAEDMERDHTGVPIALGIVPNMVRDVLVFDYHDPASVEQIRAHAHELAAVLVEPVQSRKPGYQPKALLHALRAMTAEENIVLIFDEIITGFRIHPGGAQAHFGVKADLVTYGKIIGGGLPIGVIAGRTQFMNALDGGTWQYGDHSYPQADTTFFAGTFCKHPLSLAAARALLQELQAQGPALQEELNARTTRFVADIQSFLAANEVPMQVNNFGSLFYFSITSNMDLFFYHLLEKGVYIWEGRTCFLSTAHTDEDIALIAKAIKQSVRELQQAGFLPKPSGISEAIALESTLASRSLSVPSLVEENASANHLPLSFSQESLWFIDQMGGSIGYHERVVYRLKGALQTAALSHTLQTIVNRHKVLRTVIRQEEGHPYPFVLPKDKWTLTLVEGERYQKDPLALEAYISSLVNTPFNLAQDHMLRAQLIRLSSEEHILVLTIHHVAFDGWSAYLLMQELIELYGAEIEGRLPLVPSLDKQFADYAVWQRSYLTGSVLAKQLVYWKEKLDGVEPLNLATDFARPAVQSTQGAKHFFHLNRELFAQLQSLSRKQDATLFMTMLAAFKVLLSRYSGQEDICVGTSIAGRNHEEFEELIGFFVNTLALRSDVSTNPSFVSFLKQVKDTTLDAYEHQEMPFEKIVEAVEKDRDISRSSLFQVMFELYNTPPIPALRLGNLTLDQEKLHHTTTLFDLSFCLEEEASGLSGYVEYCVDLFAPETIERMVGHYESLLYAIVQSPTSPVGSFSMLKDAERQQLLVAFNDTAVVYSSEQTFLDLFTAQATATPQAIALIFGDQPLTYQALEERSNQLANYLIKQGIQADTLVPLCLERGLEMIIGVLGIMKAGGAYVPIDPEYPAERLHYMLEDCQATLVVSSQYGKTKLAHTGLPVLALDADQLAKEPPTPVASLPQPTQLAYVIYTSGSTGKPKGAMVEHQGMLNHLWAKVNELQVDANTIIAYTASYTFDISVWQML
ncbi:MAG: aminotransferase class III-fold pyridoxal phosphate-dependent enzyme, partial [Bacteroidota bacterium]